MLFLDVASHVSNRMHHDFARHSQDIACIVEAYDIPGSKSWPRVCYLR